MTFINGHDFRKICFLLIGSISFSPIVSNSQAKEVNNWMLQGNKHFAEKSYEKAISCYNRVIEEDPNNTHAWHNQGTALGIIGQPKEALDSFRRVLEIDSNYLSTYKEQATEFQKLKRFPEANASLQRADKIAKQWQTEAESLYSSGNYRQALVYCDMLLYHNTFEAWAWNMKGACFSYLGNYEDALMCSNQALEKGRANDYVELSNKANYLCALQRHEEAIHWYDQALQIKPDYVPALQSKADALEAVGNQTEANSIRKTIRDMRRWESLKEKSRKWSLQTTIVALLLGCICFLIRLLAGPSWIVRSGIAAVLVAVCGGLFWFNLRLTWVPFVSALGITALFTIVLYLYHLWDEGEAEREKINIQRAEIKRQVQLNRDSEKISMSINRQLSSRGPLENILPKISPGKCEAIAKAISSIDSLNEADKVRLFYNLGPDYIATILHYFNDSEIEAILQHMKQEKRADILMRFPLQKRSRIVSTSKCGQLKETKRN